MFRARHALRVLARCPAPQAIAFDERALMISVLDYGAGNLRSVENTLGAIGVEHELVRDEAGLRRAG